MGRWLRFELNGKLGFGMLEDGVVQVYHGDMFSGPSISERALPLSDVRVRTPCDPSKMICLWNNFSALAAKLGSPPPDEPLYLLKAPSAFLGQGETIRRPKSYDGKVVYEGELGIVIGKRCFEIGEADAKDHIFGYTCINDVTAAEIIGKDPTFAQWTRAKSFNGFGVFGPVIATDLDPMGLRIKTVLNGEVRQDYPVSDMVFPPAMLVSLISRDMTLLPGDVIACGTSIGVGAMKEPTNTVEVTIDGVGTLRNIFQQ
ncbi:MAG: fumarylacetoacetate hydrolase family protein [Methyloceanibacter sp.]